MKKLLIATTNPGKLRELSEFLSDLPLELVSIFDILIYQKPEESGNTFEDNAILKAKFYRKLSGLPTLADDGGLEIDALNGEPGVKTRRWIDGKTEANDGELIAYAFKRLKNVPNKNRGAQLRVVLALALPNGKVHTVEETVRGIIPKIPSSHRELGYPFRSLLFLPQINKFYTEKELTTEETERFNHRRRAVAKLKLVIQDFIEG